MVEPSQSARDAAADYFASLGLHGDAEAARNHNRFRLTVQAFAQAEQRGHAQGAAEVEQQKAIAHAWRLQAEEGAAERAELVAEAYLVWSNEHRSWWGPNRCGYFISIDKAGRYTREEAINISFARGGWERNRNPDEIAVRESDAYAMTDRAALSPPRVREDDEQQEDV